MGAGADGPGRGAQRLSPEQFLILCGGNSSLWYEMVSLWIMSPTMTNRRHFFLIEGPGVDADRVKDALASAGFRSSDETESRFSNGLAQVVLRRSSPVADPAYLGGAISPNDDIIRKAKEKERLMGVFGKLFFLSLATYLAMWVVAFAAVLTEVPILLQFLGPAIPLMYLVYLGLGVCISGVGFSLDIRSSKQNQQLANETHTALIPPLQDAFHADIRKLSIPTKLGDRRIKAHVPEDISGKIERWGLGTSTIASGTKARVLVPTVREESLSNAGAITDIRFRPADRWKPSVGMTPEKERMKELCAPVCEWVKTLK